MAFDIISYLMGSQSSGGGGSTGGINFKSVTLEDDGNYTAVDTKNNTHTITPTTNSDGVITAIVYDDVSINLTYDSEGNLTKIGDSDVDVSLYPEPTPIISTIGYTVTFKVDGSDYYVAQCLEGDTITEPPIPTSQSGTFTAWQLNGTDVSFPYTPSVDVELSAHFQAVRSEMEVYNAGTVISTSCTKLNDGLAIVGGLKYWATSGFWINVSMLVAKTADAASMSSSITNGTITYEGETWYWNRGSGTGDFWLLDQNMSDSNLATAILNHYFYKD